MDIMIMLNGGALIASCIIAFILARYGFKEKGIGPIFPTLLVIFMLIANFIVFPIVNEAILDSKLQEDPLMQAIKKNETKIYIDLLTKITEENIKSPEKIELATEELLNDVLLDRLAKASNEIVSKNLTIHTKHMKLLLKRNNGDCYDIKSNLKEMRIDLLNDPSALPVPRKSVATEQMNWAGRMLYSKFGSGLTLMKKQNPSKEERQKICRMHISLYETLNRPYDNERMEALRYMLTN